jgi:putative transposase
MRKARFTEEQMVAIIREADNNQVSAVAKRHSAASRRSTPKRKCFGGFGAHEVNRLKQLEAENARLKKLVAERDLEIEVMKEVGGSLLRVTSSDSAHFAPNSRLHLDNFF